MIMIDALLTDFLNIVKYYVLGRLNYEDDSIKSNLGWYQQDVHIEEWSYAHVLIQIDTKQGLISTFFTGVLKAISNEEDNFIR